VAPAASFRLGAGDSFSLSVFNEISGTQLNSPNITGEYRIDPDGNVQLHLVGTVHLEGLTLEEARVMLNERLGEYLLNPDVTLTLTTIRSRYVYVLGYVAHQRVLTIGTRDTVLDVLASCGGELYDARLDCVKVIRGGLANPEILTVDLLATIQDGDFSQNIVVQPGDIIYFPRTLLREWNEIISRVMPSISMIDTAVEIITDDLFED